MWGRLRSSFGAIRSLLVAVCLLLASQVRAERATIGGPTGPDGTEVACDMPATEHIKNVGGRDGAGLCVFTSIEHSGRWQNCEGLRGFQQKMRSEPGGGYPEKVDRMMKKYVQGAKYVQYSGNDPAILDLAIKTGRMPAVTYGYSERYGGRVAHMVNLVHLDGNIACVLDNNFIGADKLEWMSRGEFLRRWKLGGGGWAVIVLNPPPPPVPVNVAPAMQLAYGAWGPSGCGPVGPTRSVRIPPEEKNGVLQNLQAVPSASVFGRGCEWKFRPDDTTAYLFRNGVQVGGWDADAKRWMDYDASKDRWTDGYPPWRADQLPGNGDRKVGQNYFGVDRNHVPLGETYSVNGQRVDYRSASGVFGDDTLSDDSGKLRITMCGTKEVCDRVMSDMKIHPAIASMSSRFLVQSYRPGTWPVEVFRRPVGESFFLSISGPPDKKSRGIEYHAQTAYENPDQLALAMDGALRRADPTYDPTRTPDLTKPKPPPPIPVPEPPPGDSGNTLLILLAALLALLFGGKRNASSK